ncbi:MAG: GNAT family N-acetyltransferase [Planctomycetes bacterium]|nr:GNAT family N-acetyltransferase [Planctomycetota bacterium]
MRITIRELAGDDRAAVALAVAAGAHGVYVQNALARGEGEGFVLSGDGRDAVLAWTGPRGNLVLVGSGELAPRAVVRTVDELFLRRRPWRIAMGPAAVVDALRERLQAAPLAFRDQVYYAGSAATVARAHVRADMRPAQRADRDRLVQATLLLNQSDLNVDPARVDRRWLRDTIDERILAGTTLVLGPLGGPWCKLDLGSDGPGGRMIEGVFTFPEQRGQGLATALVASCLAAAPAGVCLHVGKHNRPARAAYERSGMQAAGGCRLLLLP